MALEHARPGAVIDVAPLGARLPTTRSHALFKSADLEVMRLVLHAGDVMPPHAVAGEMTLQCVEGRIALGGDAGDFELAAGQLVHFGRGQMHALRGLEDASLLLTIALRPQPN